jgi:ABC-type multidrug transport system fused ATPase/permease subunit
MENYKKNIKSNRTGSGKSTLTLGLLRILEITEN